MSYGMEIYNEDGQLMFQNGGRTTQLIARGSVTILAGEIEAFVNTGISATLTRDLPLVLLDEQNAFKTYNTGLSFNTFTNTWVFFAMRSANNVTLDLEVNWFLYDTHNGIAAPTGYGINIFNADGELNWSSEVAFLRPIKCGPAQRSLFPVGMVFADEIPIGPRYLESRTLYAIRKEFETDDEFTQKTTTNYVARYNGNQINPAFEDDSFNGGSTVTQDGGSGGIDGITYLYGDYVPMILAHHPDA